MILLSYRLDLLAEDNAILFFNSRRSTIGLLIGGTVFSSLLLLALFTADFSIRCLGLGLIVGFLFLRTARLLFTLMSLTDCCATESLLLLFLRVCMGEWMTRGGFFDCNEFNGFVLLLTCLALPLLLLLLLCSD